VQTKTFMIEILTLHSRDVSRYVSVSRGCYVIHLIQIFLITV